ncbi:hypothetical protein BC332_28284 [Capsicum chinense]|nr:hypothetical protein BC332_28284 [Capsicum chinense]
MLLTVVTLLPTELIWTVFRSILERFSQIVFLNPNNDNCANGDLKNQLLFGSSMKQEIVEEFGNENRYKYGGVTYGVGVQMQIRGNLNNGFMRKVGNFRASVGNNREASTSINAFSNHISYSSAQSSSSNFMPSIAENES